MQSLKKIHAWAQMQDPLLNFYLHLEGMSTFKAFESEMQALIIPCNLLQTRSKSDEK